MAGRGQAAVLGYPGALGLPRCLGPTLATLVPWAYWPPCYLEPTLATLVPWAYLGYPGAAGAKPPN